MADSFADLVGEPSTGMLKSNADWASRFRETGTNLARRARQNQQLTQYVDRLQQMQAAAQLQELQTNRVAQSYAFRQAELDRQKVRDMEMLKTQHDNFLLRQQQKDAADQLRQAKTQATLALGNDLLQANQKFTPGTVEHAQAIMNIGAKYPLADQSVLRPWQAMASKVITAPPPKPVTPPKPPPLTVPEQIAKTLTVKEGINLQNEKYEHQRAIDQANAALRTMVTTGVDDTAKATLLAKKAQAQARINQIDKQLGPIMNPPAAAPPATTPGPEPPSAAPETPVEAAPAASETPQTAAPVAPTQQAPAVPSTPTPSADEYLKKLFPAE